MPKYTITTEHRYELETDDIGAVIEGYEYPIFREGVIGEAEYLDGKSTYEEVSNA